MLLHHATWEDIEGYLERSTGIIIPTGSTEQHGPIGLIGTDTICPQSIAERAAANADILVGPSIAFGAAQFNLGFPGTVSARPTTLIALVRDYVGSLARNGFTRFYFLNGHGGNVAPIKSAFQEIYADTSLAPGGNRPSVRCRLRNWWDLPAVDTVRNELYGEWEGMHATPSEVAITQHALPATVRRKKLRKPEKLSREFLRNHAQDDHLDAEEHRRRFPDGRVGSDTALATPEDGKRLFDAAVLDMLEDYNSFLDEG